MASKNDTTIATLALGEAALLRSYELPDVADALLALVLAAEGNARILRSAYDDLAATEGYPNICPAEMASLDGPEEASSLVFALARVLNAHEEGQ